VHDQQGKHITNAEIYTDGTIKDLQTGILYAHPSALRAKRIKRNGHTYKRFYLNGKNLHSLGVVP
jgi:hypothetical protein